MENKSFADDTEYKQIMPAVGWWAFFKPNSLYEEYEPIAAWAIVEKEHFESDRGSHYVSLVIGLIASKDAHYLIEVGDVYGFICYKFLGNNAPPGRPVGDP